MTWHIERVATRAPHLCALVWMPNFPRGIGAYTIAAFHGAEGEAAAHRILAELREHADPTVGPDPWTLSCGS